MKTLPKLFAAAMTLSLFAGCSTFPAWLPSSGPSVEQVVEQDNTDSPIQVIDVNDAVARRALAARRTESFDGALGSKSPPAYTVGAGDVLEVSIWEAPPAALFGSSVGALRSGISTTSQTTLPEQIVNADGVINVPFAGTVAVAGKTAAG